VGTIRLGLYAAQSVKLWFIFTEQNLIQEAEEEIQEEKERLLRKKVATIIAKA